MCIVIRLPEWFPGASWKREGKVWKELVHRMIEEPFKRVKLEEVRLVSVVRTQFMAFNVRRGIIERGYR